MTAKPNTAARAIQEQVENNRSGVDHAASFAGHRARMTAEILARAPEGGRGRLALLGAGNSFDVDLSALGAAFGEIHLIDVDGEAVARARARAPEAVRQKIYLHAPVDVTGSWDVLADWARRTGAWETQIAEVGSAVARVLAQLPGPFDVVVSCCMLTQLQLVLLDVVDDRHPGFDALRTMMNAIHVRVIVGLMAPDGRGLLVTDLTSDETYPLDIVAPEADLAKLMSDLLAVGNVIHASHPGLLSAEVRRDPELAPRFTVRFPVGPWLWHNGPERIFLVYGLDIAPVGASPSVETPPGPITQSSAPAHAQTVPASSSLARSAPARSGGPPVNIIEMESLIPKLYEDMIEAEANALGWFFHAESARPNLEFQQSYGGFYHMAYDLAATNPVQSAINAILVPLLFIYCDKAKIPFTTLLRIRLGMFARTPIDVPFHNPHVDFYAPHNVALYYVNDSDGDTVIFNETYDDVSLEQSVRLANENKFTEAKRFAPKKGRMIGFDGKHYHSSMHPRHNQHRMVITFNFR